ncbi:MAG: FAD-binding protein [Burkholderiales bacterium]|nr:FAD-binding protein [Burkholderiales bacterium]
MVNSLSFDMLVVGAGPAGCAAAIRAATHGLTVGIIERDPFPRDLPGESLHPDIDHLFDELGVREAVADAGFVKHPGWILEHQGEPMFMPFGEPLSLRFGYQAWRADLDEILLAQARDSGVEVLHETSAREVLVSDGRVTGVQTQDRQLMSDHVIDATGARRWLSRRLSICARALSPRLIARYGYSDRDFGLGSIPLFREHTNGWTWLAKVRKDTCQCVQLSLTPDVDLPSLPEHYGFPAKLRGADVTWRLVRDCAGPGYFICGDAAATLDPAASRGVARALQSGIRAGDLVVEICGGDMDEADATRIYREWLVSEFISEAMQLASRHAVLEEAPPWVHKFSEQYAHKLAH